MKLDIKNLDHQEIIKDYWLDHEKSEGLNFHDSFIMI